MKVQLTDWEATISQHSAVPEGVLVLTRTTLLLFDMNKSSPDMCLFRNRMC